MRQKMLTSWDSVPLCVDVPFVSNLLGIKPDTIQKMCADGRIKATKIAREWRITKTELKRLLGEEDTNDTT